MKNSNTPTPTASIDPPHADTAPVVKHQVELDEVDLLISAPRRYFASPEDERSYYIIKDQQEAITASLGWDATYEAKVSGAQFAQSLSSTPQPAVVPVVANTATAQAPIPVVSNTQPSPVPAASTASVQNPIVTLAWCNAWLQSTYVHELAGLALLGAYVELRAVCAPREAVSPSTSVLFTVKDGLVGGATGPDGELTFTFLDAGNPRMELGNLTASKLDGMAQRFWQELPAIQKVFEARASCIAANLASYVAAYLATSGASPLLDLPDVEDKAGSMHYQWFTGDILPKMDETQNQYPLSKLVALVNTYDQRADDGV